MRHFWTASSLLCSALLVGCGDRTAENPQDFQQQPPAVEGATPNPQASPPAEQAPAQPQAASPPQDGPGAAAPSSTRSTSARPAAPAAQPPRTGAGSTPAVSGSRAGEAPRAEAAPQAREVVVPANTALPLELMTAVSSETAKVETPVRARLRNALNMDGRTVLPAGAVLHGDVVDVARAGRVQGRSRLVLRFNEVELAGGREPLRTNPIAFEGEATKGEDATKVGAGAVGGAIIGGIIGGGSGAAQGAAIGAAAGTGAVLATRGREVTLAAGTDLAATLATPFTARVPAR